MKKIGLQGFEPWTSWTRTKRATRLRYNPKQEGTPWPKRAAGARETALPPRPGPGAPQAMER